MNNKIVDQMCQGKNVDPICQEQKMWKEVSYYIEVTELLGKALPTPVLKEKILLFKAPLKKSTGLSLISNVHARVQPAICTHKFNSAPSCWIASFVAFLNMDVPHNVSLYLCLNQNICRYIINME
jgi:hypothetical protein